MATVSSKDYREFIEEKEKEYLSPYAALSVNTRGRERPMPDSPHHSPGPQAKRGSNRSHSAGP